MKPSKEKLKNQLRQMLIANPNLSILDLGSGTSNNFVELLQEFPNFKYTAVEPWKVAADKARELTSKFGDRVRVMDQVAYKTFEVKELDNEEFDLVVSLSTLEHVKWLHPFLKYSVKKVKKGGQVIHLWDNAHANMPINLKERLQVFISKYFSFLIPASDYVAYVPLFSVRKFLESEGLTFVGSDYNNSVTYLKSLALSKHTFTKEEVDKVIGTEEMLKNKIVENGNETKIEDVFMSSMLEMRK